MQRPFPLKFRTKINLGVSIIVATIGLLLAIAVSRMAATALIDELKTRGSILAENLSLRVADSMLAMDLLRLKNMVDELTTLRDVRYAFIMNNQGRVVVHTFSGGFPVDLLDANPAPGHEISIHLLADGQERFYDFAAPIFIAQKRFGTVHVGLSRTKTQAVVNRLIFLIFGISGGALVVAVAMSTIFARRVTRRINVLREHAEEVVKGNLDLQTGPVLSKNCWEIMDCDLTHCPAYGETRRRCWYLAGTMCPDCLDSADPKVKEESCKACPVYIANKGDEIQDLAETFDVMALTLRSHLEELKEAEKVLTRQQQLMRTILDATPDFVCLLDENFEYLAVNKAFADFIGLSETDIVGRKDIDVFPDEKTRRHAENVQVLTSGKPRHQERRIERNGQEFWLNIVKVPVFDSDGKAIGILRTARNMTELKKYQEQLIQSQKMESIGKLAGGVAHEINTPLGVILGYAQLLQEDAEPGGQLRQDLSIIEKQAKVCRQIVADLLGFSRQAQSLKIEMCFNNSIMEVVSLVRHTFGMDSVEIIALLDDRFPIIYADPEKLKQVWINLLNNARDAMADGGVIVVRSRLDTPAGKVFMSVADTGTGIPDDSLKKIFEPFFSTKPVGKGTGLGLSVSFGIIEDHGGTISAVSPAPREYLDDSVPDEYLENPGSVFIVELPLYPREEAEAAPARGREPEEND